MSIKKTAVFSGLLFQKSIAGNAFLQLWQKKASLSKNVSVFLLQVEFLHLFLSFSSSGLNVISMGRTSAKLRVRNPTISSLLQ